MIRNSVLSAIYAFILTALLATAATAQDNPIVARMAQFVAAYNAQDAAAIAQFYSPDAVLLPPQQNAIQGREAIAAHYDRAFKGGAGGLQYRTLDIRATDTMAVEVGEWVIKAGNQSISGRSMHVWQVIDGQLLRTRDMYHLLKVN